MKINLKSRVKEILFSLSIALFLYILLQILPRPILADIIFEMLLFGSIGIMSGYYVFTLKSSDKNFKKLKIMIFIAYGVFVMHSYFRISFLLENPDVVLISARHFKKYFFIHLSVLFKFITYIFEFIAFIYFYKFLQITEDVKVKINVFMSGFISYFVISIIVSIFAKTGIILITGLFLGVVVGIICIFYFISTSRYFSSLIILLALTHIWEGYVKATAGNVHTHVLNFVYYFLILLYLFEIRNWIMYENSITD